MAKSYTDLIIYTRAQELYPQAIAFASGFPKEAYQLKDQIYRAANSIGANIAEGFGRSVPEFKMYLTRSLGSCNEMSSHVENAIRVGFGDSKKGKLLNEAYGILGKQIYTLRQKWS